SVVADKDLDGLLRPLLPLFSLVVATRSQSRRARLPADLAAGIAAIAAIGGAGAAPPPVVVRDDPGAALAEARRQLGERFGGGLVVVAGSIFLVGEIRARLLGETPDPRAVSDPL
ncbi:MAG TPA: hypothetical protein VFH68_11260, partial [Polyangia bacterium]|nr:hypothetical protein [Polyangia bacterium]